jgi:hypothetical protein
MQETLSARRPARAAPYCGMTLQFSVCHYLYFVDLIYGNPLQLSYLASIQTQLQSQLRDGEAAAIIELLAIGLDL